MQQLRDVVNFEHAFGDFREWLSRGRMQVRDGPWCEGTNFDWDTAHSSDGGVTLLQWGVVNNSISDPCTGRPWCRGQRRTRTQHIGFARLESASLAHPSFAELRAPNEVGSVLRVERGDATRRWMRFRRQTRSAERLVIPQRPISRRTREDLAFCASGPTRSMRTPRQNATRPAISRAAGLGPG